MKNTTKAKADNRPKRSHITPSARLRDNKRKEDRKANARFFDLGTLWVETHGSWSDVISVAASLESKATTPVTWDDIIDSYSSLGGWMWALLHRDPVLRDQMFYSANTSLRGFLDGARAAIGALEADVFTHDPPVKFVQAVDEDLDRQEVDAAE